MGHNPNAKSRVVAMVLAFFFGAAGVNKMYLGFWGWGILRLFLVLFVGLVGMAGTANGSGTGAGFVNFASLGLTAWGLWDFVMLAIRRQKVDRQGIPLR